jgi:hypothetical protein
LAAAEAFVRSFIKAHMTEHGRKKINPLVLDAWMKPMITRHPRYDAKSVG